MRQILIVILIIAIALFGRWVWKQPNKVRLRWLGYIAITLLIALAVTGKLHWLVAAGSAILGFLPILFKKLMALRWIILSSQRFRNAYQQSRQHKQQDYTGKNFADTTMTREEALEILGLNTNPTREEIVSAHKRLIQKLHPDRGGSPALAKKINTAKEALLK